ncbi:MAG TPA: alpha/beta hydrolase [Micromonosporaceae bacterium]|nr:alpha/beta hydrolase [Micromonosporaceae bacterium]
MTNAGASDKVTVALVHGAFADSSGWNGVIERLQSDNIPVTALVNPLRGVAADAAYAASAMRQIPGNVLAVGHSYGGAVITNAASKADNVVGLVYVAAFAPDEGETLLDIEGRSRDSVLTSALRQTEYPTAGGNATELSIQPGSFKQAFAADLPDKQTAIMSATQRPVAESGFGELNGPPAWKKLPSWAVVATGDKAAGADVVKTMAQRAGAKITEVEASHVPMISHPDEVANVIRTAWQSVS